MNIIKIVQRSPSRITVKERAANTVKITSGGPQGIPGQSASVYTHTQTSASDTWTINHNLGYKPSVTLLTVGGAEFEAEIVHTTNNQCICYLVSAVAGSARCN